MPISKPPAKREPEDSTPVDMYAPLLAQIPRLNKATYLVSCRANNNNVIATSTTKPLDLVV